jgi:hypothetical protein
VSAMRVKGERPFRSDMKSLESDVSEPSLQRTCSAHGYVLLSGAAHSVAPSELDNHNHRLAHGKPPSLM